MGWLAMLMLEGEDDLPTDKDRDLNESSAYDLETRFSVGTTN